MPRSSRLLSVLQDYIPDINSCFLCFLCSVVSDAAPAKSDLPRKKSRAIVEKEVAAAVQKFVEDKRPSTRGT